MMINEWSFFNNSSELTDILLRLILPRHALNITDQLANPLLLRAGEMTPKGTAAFCLHAQFHAGLGLRRLWVGVCGAGWLPPVELGLYHFDAPRFLS